MARLAAHRRRGAARHEAAIPQPTRLHPPTELTYTKEFGMERLRLTKSTPMLQN